MRDWKNVPTKDLIRKVLIHGYLMANQNMPLKFEDEDDFYASLLAEIQKRIDDGYERGYAEGRCKFDEYECYG